MFISLWSLAFVCGRPELICWAKEIPDTAKAALFGPHALMNALDADNLNLWHPIQASGTKISSPWHPITCNGNGL